MCLKKSQTKNRFLNNLALRRKTTCTSHAYMAMKRSPHD